MEADVVMSPVRRSLRLAEKCVATEDGGHVNYQVSSLAQLPEELDIGYLSNRALFYLFHLSMNGHTYNTYSLVHSLSTIVDFALSHTFYFSHTLLCSSWT